MQRSRAGFSDFVPDCMIIHLFLVGWVMYFFVRFLCRFYLTNTPVTTNQACCACIPYAGMYNKYLFYYLMSMRQTYIGMAEGGAQPNISKEKIVNSILPLPPLEEQHRIVAKLEEILPLCERLK